MRCLIHVTALISMLNNGEMVNGLHKVSNLVDSVALASPNGRRFLDKKLHHKSSVWKENYYFPKSMGKMNPPLHLEADLGILIANQDSGKMVTRLLFDFLETCPATCTNEDLCACLTDYENAVTNMSCPSVFTKACNNLDELKMCITDSSVLAVASYLHCPLLECLDSSGIGFYDYDPETYYMCTCEAYTNFCQVCEEDKDTPFCDVLTSYSCANFVKCCATESTLDGLTKCNDIFSEITQASLRRLTLPRKWNPSVRLHRGVEHV